MKIEIHHCWSLRRFLFILLLASVALLFYTTPSYNWNSEYLYLTQESDDVNQCPVLYENSADIDTVETYQTFDFQAKWVKNKHFWDNTFEARYEKERNDTSRPKLMVFVVPHSHNDPGWLETFENYFKYRTKRIIDNIVTKLTQYPNMTFIWTEISLLSAWWETASREKQEALKKIIKEGRLEITSGGWVMPDEACTHIYSIIDQFIEGHQWLKNNLDVEPKTGWAVDTFGHGPTVPHLLSRSGLEGAITLRIHYNWKQWFAKQQIADFLWVPTWSTQKSFLTVHNLPFDLYNFKFSCGPHPTVCFDYDFRYDENNITEQNVHNKSKSLIEQYAKIGSLTTHNVILVPIGDDFRYNDPKEFDNQYTNYMKLFNYINNNQDLFNADVQFGTPLDYFNALKERYKSIPTLKGDFFVYSDIFNEGAPAYWSGYFTTRPYNKILTRQLEHQLRTTEILFTLVLNLMHNKTSCMGSAKIKKMYYEQLINARRNLGITQHHDAITGTSKKTVMEDYGKKLLTSLAHCVRLQEVALTAAMIPQARMSILQSETKWETYGKPTQKLQVTVPNQMKVIVFNPLTETRTEIITIHSNTTKVRVYDTSAKKHVQYQISPIFELRKNGKKKISSSNFEVSFVATIPGLTAVTFDLEEYSNESHHAKIFCNNCKNHDDNDDVFVVKNMPSKIRLENSVLKLFINRNTGFLKMIHRKDTKKTNIVKIQVGAYESDVEHSGAYLFKVASMNPKKNILNAYSNLLKKRRHIIITKGPVTAEIKVLYLPLLVHTVRIYKVEDHTLSSGVFVENTVDLEEPDAKNQTELFMRIDTNIRNGNLPEFYTDQNGFQYQKRVKVEKLGIVGNYYPITTMAWLQDKRSRLTLVTNHAQGAASLESGRLEVMLDRRTEYDDGRGIHEGMTDNKRTTIQNWLLLESMSESVETKTDTTESIDSPDGKARDFNERESSQNKKVTYQLPSQAADYLSRTLNYPVHVYLVDTRELDYKLKSNHSFVKDFPTGLHLVTLRTIPENNTYPSSSSFMVLQRPGHSCSVNTSRNRSFRFSSNAVFNGLPIKSLTAASLTGLKTYEDLKTMADIHLDTMDVRTYKIGF